ncbi:hypothetical protein Dsin_012600 [Dipteronia sinensis]|uniref:ribose-phosphate diphosphokinase n=1 Tax=Dipteronia sinensis TaxID=43782 RepID=A0AAE0AJ33_9ROSI|nr:hypothetical protein Dsin_012600 [Dipteronia sinensis]
MALLHSSASALTSAATLFSRNNKTSSLSGFQHRIRCNVVEPLKYENGYPFVSTFSNDFLASKSHLDFTINKNDTRLRIFSGTANPALSQEIACYMGLELGKIKIKRFADGEIYVQLQESVRGCDVFLVQPTCPPANENLMELLVMIDACRRASAKNITAVIPYFGYARADRKTQGRESIACQTCCKFNNRGRCKPCSCL